MQHSIRYTLTFAVTVSFAASILVATSAVVLRNRQEANRVLDRQRKVLDVADLVAAGERLSARDVNRRFSAAIRAIVIELQTGMPVDSIASASFDQRERSRDPATSRLVRTNPAGVQRVPMHALIYHVIEGDEIDALILPIEGQGLWATIYGFIALSPDLEFVRGITFYEHRETPGLGGEINAPEWRVKWRGRRPFDDEWVPRIRVIKGAAPRADVAPFDIDGLSGATLTGRAVTNIVQYWLGDHGFGPYLERYRREVGIQ